MSRLIIRPAAEADIQEASDWYDGEERGVGVRFIDELRNTFARVRETPLQFPNIGRGIRRALLRRFPYAIYFVLRGERQSVVIAVLHQRRNPVAWKKRLGVEVETG